MTRLSLAVCAVFLFSFPAFAQDVTGKIAGVITDPSGSAVPNAQVTVVSLATSAAKQTTTDNNGFYEVGQLAPGLYRVEAVAPGFSKVVSNGRDSLHINETLRVDLRLQLGSVSNTVEVNAQPTGVETQN